MATTITPYNHTSRLFFSGKMPVDSSEFRLVLLDSDASFTAGHESLAEVLDDGEGGTHEVSGNGWSSGGEVLSGVTVKTVSTNGAMFDASDVSVTAMGDITAYAAVLYGVHDSTNYPLFYIDFGEAKTATSGNPFNVIWDVAGVWRIAFAT